MIPCELTTNQLSRATTAVQIIKGFSDADRAGRGNRDLLISFNDHTGQHYQVTPLYIVSMYEWYTTAVSRYKELEQYRLQDESRWMWKTIQGSNLTNEHETEKLYVAAYAEKLIRSTDELLLKIGYEDE